MPFTLMNQFVYSVKASLSTVSAATSGAVEPYLKRHLQTICRLLKVEF